MGTGEPRWHAGIGIEPELGIETDISRCGIPVPQIARAAGGGRPSKGAEARS